MTRTAQQLNIDGQFFLDNFLTHPDTNVSFWNHRSLGEVIDFEIIGQGGAI